MIPLIVIRPQPGCDATVAAAAGGAGLPARGFPLFAVRPVAWQPPDPAGVDALLLGSANALRHGGAALAVYRGKPAYAVGRTTADAAHAAGFIVELVGEGGLQSVIGRLRAGHRRLLRLAGETRLALDMPAGVTVTERVVYASEPAPMPPALAELLREPAVVMLHSGEAARHFAGLCDSNGIARAPLALAAIGPRVAEAAGEGWKTVTCADRPSDAALLALAGQMCQDRPGSENLQNGA